MASSIYARSTGRAAAISSTEVNRASRAERELSPGGTRMPSGSRSSTPLKKVSRQSSRKPWGMATLAPLHV